MNKKSISITVFLLIPLLLIAACSKKNAEMVSNTTSEIKIVDKGVSGDKRELWIIAYDPNNQKESDSFKMIIKQPMVWNLIENNRVYLATYTMRMNNKSLPAEIEDLWISSEAGHQF